MEKEYFDELLSSLEDAAAFAQGDTSRAKLFEAIDPVPEYDADDRHAWEPDRFRDAFLHP